MKILVATDAWHPQVNGVVRTLSQVAHEASALGTDVEFLSPAGFLTLPMPGYAEIRLAMTGPGDIERRLDRARAECVHIATEGPIGHAVRRVCIKRGMPFTTSLHTRFPDYLAERLPVPKRWTTDVTWAWLRRFHAPGAAVLAATPTLRQELIERGFNNVKLWSRGVDANLFHPGRRQDSIGELDLPRPIFLTVGRVAVEKNLEEFLKLDLPGTKLVVGDGPAREHLSRSYPRCVPRLEARRGTGGHLCVRRCLRVSEPHRYVRSCFAGSLGERSAGCGVSSGGAARCHWSDSFGCSASRRAQRGFAVGLSGGIGT